MSEPTDHGAGWNEALDEALIFVDKVASSLSSYSEQYRREGRKQDMYRANTAWYNVIGIAEHLRSLRKPTAHVVTQIFKCCPACGKMHVVGACETEGGP